MAPTLKYDGHLRIRNKVRLIIIWKINEEEDTAVPVARLVPPSQLQTLISCTNYQLDIINAPMLSDLVSGRSARYFFERIYHQNKYLPAHLEAHLDSDTCVYMTIRTVLSNFHIHPIPNSRKTVIKE